MATKKADNTATQPESNRPSAEKVLGDFLRQNGITLVYPSINTMVRMVDDGSVFIQQPRVSARYTDE